MAQKELQKGYEKLGVDPFSVPPAGYSLTQPEGKWPWDSPPEHVDIKEAYKDIEQRMEVPERKLDLLRLMDAGVPIETIARTISFGAFTNGKVNPDLAELLNVPISLKLLTNARKAGISPKFNNSVELDIIPQDDIMDLMRDLNPTRYAEVLSNNFDEEMPSEEEEKSKPEFDKNSFMSEVENTNGN